MGIKVQKVHSQHCSILLGLGQPTSHMCRTFSFARVQIRKSNLIELNMISLFSGCGREPVQRQFAQAAGEATSTLDVSSILNFITQYVCMLRLHWDF